MNCPYCDEQDCWCADMELDNQLLEIEMMAERLNVENKNALALYHSQSVTDKIQ